LFPGGREGTTIGKTIFTCVYIEKKSTSPEPAGQFQSNLIHIILGYREFQIIQIKDHPLPKGDNAEMGWRHLKIFSRTTELEELIFT
jgi:hypothetical protein